MEVELEIDVEVEVLVIFFFFFFMMWKLRVCLNLCNINNNVVYLVEDILTHKVKFSRV